MEKRLSVVPKGKGFVIQVSFVEKNKVYVTESSKNYIDRSEANSVAHNWSKIYGAKLQA